MQYKEVIVIVSWVISICELFFKVKNLIVDYLRIFKFYMFFKIYKVGYFGRLIVWVCNCFIFNICVYLDLVMVLLVK